MMEQEYTVEVHVPVTVRVTVKGPIDGPTLRERVEAALEIGWTVANGLDSHPLPEEVWESGFEVGLDVPTYAGNAVLCDAGGSVLEELN
jgi:hypothetical protein